MKRAISLFFAIMLCLSFCACGGTSKEPAEAPQAPVEKVSVNTLFSNSDNGAKAQLNVGKGTTVYGCVTSVGASACTVQLIYPKNASLCVEMPVEQLAELRNGQFIAVEGIVTAYNASAYGMYTISANKMLDLTVMDAYIRDTVDAICSSRFMAESTGIQNATGLHSVFCDSVSTTLLDKYVHQRGDTFLMKDKEQFKAYLLGEWVYSFSYDTMKPESCEYKADGTYLWKYQKESYTGKVYAQEQTGEWTVSGGDLKSFRGQDTKVYVLCDDLFFQMGQVHIRVK